MHSLSLSVALAQDYTQMEVMMLVELVGLLVERDDFVRVPLHCA